MWAEDSETVGEEEGGGADGRSRWEWLESYYKQPAIASYLERIHMRFLTQSWLWGNLNYQVLRSLLPSSSSLPLLPAPSPSPAPC